MLHRAPEILPHALGRANERIARAVLRRAPGLPFPLHRISVRWDRESEIDGVGINEADRLVFAEVKWSLADPATDIVCVAGSLFLVADALRWLRSEGIVDPWP